MVQHHILQEALQRAIRAPSFQASLPPLDQRAWERILCCTSQARAENERLEFVGDALMYATLGRLLYNECPNGTPHLYTCVRAVLHSNATFSLLAEKLDIMGVSNEVLKALTSRTFGEGSLAPCKNKLQIKSTADMFETMIAAYCFATSFESLCAWVDELYRPLVRVVAETFISYQHGPHGTLTGPGQKKRTLDPFVYHRGPLISPVGPSVHHRSGAPSPSPSKSKRKAMMSPARSSRMYTLDRIRGKTAVRPSVKASIIGPSNAIVKVPSPRLPSVTKQAPTTTVDAPAVKAAPIFIDLTLDSDSEDNQPPVRRPLVTPRILPRSRAVSNRPAAATPPAQTPPLVPAAGPQGSSSSEESEDELMLENMLVDEVASSDMDLGSSDVEAMSTPTLEMLTRTGLGSALDITKTPTFTQRPMFLR